MRRLTAAVAIGCGLLLTGCGAPATPPATPPTTPPGTVSSTPAEAAGCPATLAVSETDTGRALCVSVHGEVQITLHGTAGRHWDRIQAGGSVLREESPSSAGTSTEDNTVATFTAVQTGTGLLTSSRPACPPPSPGAVACHAREAFTVTIRVA